MLHIYPFNPTGFLWKPQSAAISTVLYCDVNCSTRKSNGSSSCLPGKRAINSFTPLLKLAKHTTQVFFLSVKSLCKGKQTMPTQVWTQQTVLCLRLLGDARMSLLAVWLVEHLSQENRALKFDFQVSCPLLLWNARCVSQTPFCRVFLSRLSTSVLLLSSRRFREGSPGHACSAGKNSNTTMLYNLFFLVLISFPAN